MHDIGPSWSEGTISYLIGKSPHQHHTSNTFRVEFLETSTISDTNSNTKTARLYFGSQDDMYKTTSLIPIVTRYFYLSGLSHL